MKAPREPLFLAQGRYRRRRLVDAARVLPFVGLFLFLVPVLWGGDGPVRTAWGGAYVFAVWAGLIVAAAALSRFLARGAGDDGAGDG